MPTRFRNFLRKKGSPGSSRSTSGHSHTRGRRTSDDSGVEKYEYGVDQPTGLAAKKGRFSFSAKKLRDKVSIHRSSRSLGAAEVKGRLMSFDSNMSESDDFFEENVNNFINKKFSVVRNSDGSNDINDNNYTNNNYGNLNTNNYLGGNDQVDESENDESRDAGQELDRACVRLDGIEVYAIVSALTCATAISCFDNYEPTPLSEIIRDRALFKLLAEFFYYCSGALGMMTGLHATLIFSLVTMYGRTALGIDRDEAFNSFFGNTGAARYNGFRSFRYSLYCFMTQLTFLITRKFFFEPLRPLVLLFTAYMSYDWLYFDSESVLKAAGVIYAPVEDEPSEEEDDEEEVVDPKNRRASMMQMKKGSVKNNKSFSLSTRTFGVDTSSQRRSSFVFANTSNFGIGGSNNSNHSTRLPNGD